MPNVPTGAALPRVLPYAGPAHSLSLGAVDRAARDLGCKPAQLCAVLIVETGMRNGFLADGRPRILYEAHIAHRLCGRPVPGLSVKAWDRTLYAPTGAGEYERLHRAIAALGEEVALKAASWGVGQVLGTNHSLCGFTTISGFVRAMGEGEDQQLGAVVAFIRARRLVEALRRIGGDPASCSPLAEGYNGTGYRLNAYHEKLAAAYRRVIAGTPDDGTLSIGDFGPDVASLQRALTTVGFRIAADGDFGRMTRNAVEQVQVAHGWPPTGIVDTVTAAALGIG